MKMFLMLGCMVTTCIVGWTESSWGMERVIQFNITTKDDNSTVFTALEGRLSELHNKCGSPISNLDFESLLTGMEIHLKCNFNACLNDTTDILYELCDKLFWNVEMTPNVTFWLSYKMENKSFNFSLLSNSTDMYRLRAGEKLVFFVSREKELTAHTTQLPPQSAPVTTTATVRPALQTEAHWTAGNTLTATPHTTEGSTATLKINMKTTTASSTHAFKPSPEKPTGLEPVFHVAVGEDDYDYDCNKRGRGDEERKQDICNYNPCRHFQRPCSEVFFGCLCPGLTPDSVPPHVPTMDVVGVTHNSVQVRWCAPDSVVGEYQLEAVRLEGSVAVTQNVSSLYREITMFALLEGHSYTICLKAKNNAGFSSPSCAAIRTNNNNQVYIYTLAGIAGLFAVVALIPSVLLYKQSKKQSLGIQHLTSLISIPNPAFYNEETPGSSTNVFNL